MAVVALFLSKNSLNKYILKCSFYLLSIEFASYDAMRFNKKYKWKCVLFHNSNVLKNKNKIFSAEFC